MIKDKILVIGASGQIGVELTLALRKIYGNANVVASDLREQNPLLEGTGPYVSLDVMNKEMLYSAILAGDYNLIMGINVFSIVGVSTAMLIVDLIYPLLDPRVRYQ